MNEDAEDSVTHWLHGLKTGDSVAAQALWDRYFGQLVRIAEAKLQHIARDADGEDVALSAMKSVMIGIRNDRFPSVSDRASLWPLLVTITARKAITEMRRQLRKKRKVTATISLAEIEDYVGRNPSPEFAAQVADELGRLVSALDDPTLTLVAVRKLEGATHQEIANELGCSAKTVLRKLNRIRREWEVRHEAELESTGDAE